MTPDTETTTDHEAIKRWAEDRHGSPAVAKGSEGAAGPHGVLYIDFAEETTAEKLEPISWEDWFEQFDALDLAMDYQPQDEGTSFRMVRRSES